MNLKYHSHYRAEGDKRVYIDVEVGCELCKEKFERAGSICAFCWKKVSNREFLKNNYHQTGQCNKRIKFKIPKQSWKTPLPYPMPGPPHHNWLPATGQLSMTKDSRQVEYPLPTTLKEFNKFWGLA